MRRFAIDVRIFWSLILIFALLSANLFGALIAGQKVYAASQITSRSITLSSSKTSAATTTYSVSFQAASTTVIKGIVVDICSNSPLIGGSCSTTVTSSPNSGSVSVKINGGGATSYSVDTTNSTTTGLLIITNGSGITPSLVTDVITFSFTATNPSALGTFYGRILTYSSGGSASAYTHAAPGTPVAQGGVAMSTANEITVSARVQEQLTFCVGATTVNDATTSLASDCTGTFVGGGGGGCGNAVDIGLVNNAGINVSPVTTGNGGNNCNGAAMVQTNASNGVTIAYFAEPNGSNHTGSLRVSGATCATDGTEPSTVFTDQCFNSDPAQFTLPKGTERFGVTVAAINCGAVVAYTCTYSSGTYNMTRDAVYDGTGANTYPTDGSVSDGGIVTSTTNAGYAWDASGSATTPRTLASSAASTTKVVDDEVLILKFAATASVTTPTGQYTVVSNYIATPVY